MRGWEAGGLPLMVITHGDQWQVTKKNNAHLTKATTTHFKRIVTIHLTGHMSVPHMDVRLASLRRRSVSYRL